MSSVCVKLPARRYAAVFFARSEHLQISKQPCAGVFFSILCLPDFNPFTTAFSRKSHTHLQERAEKGLANFTERQERRQQRFSRIEDRNITILLPQMSSQKEVPDASERDSVETEKSEDIQQHELEIVAQLWRDRMAHDDIERFETAASKKLRLLRASKIYSYVILRVRLPGGVFLQGRFSLQETLKVRVYYWNYIISEQGAVTGAQ